MKKMWQALKNLGAVTVVAFSASYAAPASAATPTWEDLGGYLTTAPAAVSWAPGHIDAFVLGGNYGVYVNTFNDGAGWGGYVSLGFPSDGPLTSAPTAASYGPGRVDVFARGANYALKHIWYDRAAGAWSNWEDLGGYLTSAPAAVSTRFGRIDVFVLGIGGVLCTTSWDGQYRNYWTNWQALGASPQPGGWQFDPAVTKSRDGNGIDIFLIGPNRDLMTNRYSIDAGPAWSNAAWTSWGGYVNATPAAASWPGHTEVIVVGGANDFLPLYKRSYDDGIGLSGYEYLGGNWPMAPAAATNWSGRVDYFAVKPGTMSLQHATQTDWAENVARAYAPRIQLHPNEQYMPSSIEFADPNLYVRCGGVNVADSILQAPASVLSRSDCFWTTRDLITDFDPYRSLPHFFGQNPATTNVPVYVSIYNLDANNFVAEYKLFFPYNYGKWACVGLAPDDNCIGARVLMDNHVGDWEGMAIRFTNGAPSAMFVAAHDSDKYGHVYTGGELAQYPKVANHPIVYSAQGSHGLWGTAGAITYDIIETGDHLVDHTGVGGVSWDTWNTMKVVAIDGVTRADTAWFSYKGRWGNSSRGLSAAQMSGGLGPADEFQLNPGPPPPAFDRDRSKMKGRVINDLGYGDRRWLVDFNGDGKADFCRAVGDSGQYLACSLSTSSGPWGEYDVFVPISDWGYSDRRWMVDFNGDGKADLCRAVGNNNGNLLACSFSTGSGLTGDSFFPVTDWGYPDRRWMVDFNGDGKADFCRAVGDNNGEYLACSLSTGTGLSGPYTASAYITDWGYGDRRWMADFDGDKKADFCRAVGNNYGEYFSCSLSTGSSLAGAYSTFSHVGDWGYDELRWMADINGDGKADLCRAVGTNKEFLGCSLSTGAGLAGEYDILLPVNDWSRWDRRWMADVDGDHRADFAYNNGYMNLLQYVNYTQ